MEEISRQRQISFMIKIILSRSEKGVPISACLQTILWKVQPVNCHLTGDVLRQIKYPM